MKKTLSLLLSLVLMLSMIPAVSAAGFDDVKSSDWFSTAVDYVVTNKLMGGYNATTFGPNDTLSRAMVAQVLYNKEGQPANPGQHNFTDVPASQWYNNAVVWGTAKGVMGGYGNGKFGPDDNVTLEQIAVILWNYSGNPALTGDADALGPHSSWAGNALGWAQAAGVLDNVPFSAVTEPATRAQTAQMLTNYLSGNTESNPGTDVTGISLDITAHKMGEGWTQYLTATLSPAGAKDTITWSSSDPKVATVDQKGKVTGVAGGNATITAKASNGKTATCAIEVWHSHKLTESKPVGKDGVTEIYTCACGHSYDSWVPAVRVSSIGLGSASASVDVGNTITLTATITPANATFQDVTWSSSDPSVATVSNGTIKGIAPGTAKIYAKADGVTAYCVVSVTAAPIVFTGTGSKVISGVNIPAGSYYVEYAYSGKSNFISRLYYGSDKYDYHSITNDIGPCAGRNDLSAKVDAIVNGQLEVTHASGSWTIVFRPVSGTTTTNIRGTGFVVTGLFTATQSRYVVSMTHSGTSNFISHIVEYNADERWDYHSLSNEIGTFSGQKIVNLDPGKQYYIYVDTGSDANASWTIDLGCGDSVTTYKQASLSEIMSNPQSSSSGTVSPSTGGSSSGTSSSSTVANGMKALASTIRSNGFVTNDGEYAIAYSYDSTTNSFIVYNPSERTVEFLFGMDDYTSETVVGFEYNLSTGETGPVVFSYETASVELSGYATLDIPSYSLEDTVLQFKAISGSFSNPVANELADTSFDLAMTCWSMCLFLEADMSMEDIGFINYNN